MEFYRKRSGLARERVKAMVFIDVAVRAFDAGHMMIDADVCEGDAAGALFARLLEDPKASYLQAHYARRGCYAARVERA